jgi:hypothetical protein
MTIQAIPANINFMFEDLNDLNVILYAAKCYATPSCIDSEFDDDYKRIRYIKRLLHKYRVTGEIKERLLLNHLVVAQNVFGILPTTRMLFVRISEKDYGALKALLTYTSALPNIIKGINGKNINTDDIEIDTNLINILIKL